jgi:hypothetical protein
MERTTKTQYNTKGHSHSKTMVIHILNLGNDKSLEGRTTERAELKRPGWVLSIYPTPFSTTAFSKPHNQ